LNHRHLAGFTYLSHLAPSVACLGHVGHVPDNKAGGDQYGH
jgi:hypothetical protein